jgi:hypothetical protein
VRNQSFLMSTFVVADPRLPRVVVDVVVGDHG